MESSNKKPVTKQSTVKSLIAETPATFNGVIDALDGLADITDSGIDRIVNAIDGLSKSATTRNNLNATKEAVSKAVLRSIDKVSSVEAITIKPEPETPPAKPQSEGKAESVDIAKALSQFKDNGSSIYQHSEANRSTVNNVKNERISNSNYTKNQQQQRSSSSTTNNEAHNSSSAGGDKTEFNQLKTANAQQATLEKLSDIDVKIGQQVKLDAEKKQGKSAAVKKPKQAKESNSDKAGYYRDSNNRLRTSTGRYASKKQIAQHEKSQGKKTGAVKSSVAKHLTSRKARHFIGSAFLGSAYPELEEALLSAKFSVQSRGLTSVDGAKKYAQARKQEITDKAKTALGKGKRVAQAARQVGANTRVATKGALGAVKARFSSAGKLSKINAIKPELSGLTTSPSTVDGLKKSPVVEAKSSGDNGAIKAIKAYIGKQPASKASSGRAVVNRQAQPLTNSVFIGAQKDSEKLNKKASKEYHDAHMLKLEKLTKEVGDIEINAGGGGGGGGSILDDLLDFATDKKRKKRKGRRPSRLKNAFRGVKNSIKGSRFFGGGVKAASAIGAGVAGAGLAGAGLAGAGAAGAGGVSKLGTGVLAGGGKLLSKAVPILALATTAMDAYDGFTNKEKQQETFGLKSTEEANLGQKSAMALGSVLDLGGLTSGAFGLLGDGLGALGFEGAQEALTFDSGDIAKAIYDKGEALFDSGKGTVTSLAEGDFSGAATSAFTFLKETLPALKLFSGKDEETKETTESNKENSTANKVDSTANEVTANKDKDSGTVKSQVTTSDSTESPFGYTKGMSIKERIKARKERIKARRNGNKVTASSTEEAASEEVASVNNKAVKTEEVASEEVASVNNKAAKTEEVASDSTENPFGYTKGMSIKERIKARKERIKARREEQATAKVRQVENKGVITPVAAAQPQKMVQAEPVSKVQSVTSISNLADNRINSAGGNQAKPMKGETIVIPENAKVLAALKEISSKLDVNRKNGKPNNSSLSVGINSAPKSIPTEFSDPLMERLANE